MCLPEGVSSSEQRLVSGDWRLAEDIAQNALTKLYANWSVCGT
jgi:hypothetical protein